MNTFSKMFYSTFPGVNGSVLRLNTKKDSTETTALCTSCFVNRCFDPTANDKSPEVGSRVE